MRVAPEEPQVVGGEDHGVLIWYDQWMIEAYESLWALALIGLAVGTIWMIAHWALRQAHRRSRGRSV